MTASAPADPLESPPRRKPVRRALGWLVAAFALALAGAAAFSTTESALRLAIEAVEARSGGALRVSGATGTLWSTIRAGRIEWNGADVAIAASEVALDWSPLALASRGLVVRTLEARTLSIAFAGRGGATVPPPELLPPFDVAIERIGVGRLDWSAPPRSGTLTGLAFGYAADRRGHRLRDLALATPFGTLRGRLDVGATAPFALDGALALAGAGPLAGIVAQSRWTGNVEAPVVAAEAAARGAAFKGQATLAPFGAAPLAEIALEASDLDLAAFAERAPRTRLALTVRAHAAGKGFRGELEARNAAPGALDAGRVPIERLALQFEVDAARFAFNEATATLRGGGRASGSGTIGLAAPWPLRTTLAVRNLDLALAHSALVATRLDGSVVADLDGARRRVTADLRQGDLALAFAALVGDERADVERFRASAAGGDLEGRGRIAFDAGRTFELAARAKHFDPARFARAPRGSLSGALALSGTLAPEWQATGTVDVERGSRLADLPLAGRVRAHLEPRRIRDLDLALTLGAAALDAKGSAGASGDALSYTLTAGRLAELERFLPAGAPRPLAGALRASGTLQAEPAGVGGTVAFTATRLAVGADLRVDRVAGRAALALPGRPPETVALAARAFEFELEATAIDHPRLKLASALARAHGTFAAHALSLAARGDGIDLEAHARGALHGGTAAQFDPAALEWAGTVEALEQRGAPAFRLLAPAEVALARSRIHVGAATIAVADGRATIESLDWADARATTRGSFTGVPLTSLAALAGRPLPLATDLVLGGEWSLAATPRTNGTIAVRRERGDLHFDAGPAVTAGSLPFGTTRLDAEVRFTEDAIAARAALRATVGGSADATLALTPSGAGGGYRDARLAAQLDAEIPTLRVFQSLVGTRAVIDGRARLAAAAGGTPGAPVLTAALDADALRLDVPQQGILLRDGRLRAHLADDAFVLDEFRFAGGDGSFLARGVLARPGAAQAGGGTSLAWRAEKFRLMNRPDRRLTVDGEGTFAIHERRLAVAGALRAAAGHLSYARTAGGRLGDDVVVVGRERPVAQPRRALPVTLDLDVDLGDGFTLDAEGLDTVLAGRVRVTSDGDTLQGRGTIFAVRGTYDAFGQRLAIDRGRLIFDGPLANPALDIVAVRRNLAVEAGVELTGTVQVPQVRLVSTPPVPDGEKLAWLVTGRGLERANAADLSMLSLASATLLGSGGRPVTAQIARRIGIDEITLQGSARGTPGEGPLAGQVVSFGKRLSDRLTIAWEQGLTVADNALRIEYALSRTLTLRAEAGVVSSVGVVYRRSFE